VRQSSIPARGKPSAPSHSASTSKSSRPSSKFLASTWRILRVCDLRGSSQAAPGRSSLRDHARRREAHRICVMRLSRKVSDSRAEGIFRLYGISPHHLHPDHPIRRCPVGGWEESWRRLQLIGKALSLENWSSAFRRHPALLCRILLILGRCLDGFQSPSIRSGRMSTRWPNLTERGVRMEPCFRPVVPSPCWRTWADADLS